jgi:hypothetical protein
VWENYVEQTRALLGIEFIILHWLTVETNSSRPYPLSAEFDLLHDFDSIWFLIVA